MADMQLALRVNAAVQGVRDIEQLAQAIEEAGGDASTLREEGARLAQELENLRGSADPAALRALSEAEQQLAAHTADAQA